MQFSVEKFEKHGDRRGDLVVFLKYSDLKKNRKTFGQIYFVTFNKKGVVRGNHYHKKWKEWFGIVAGKVKVHLKDVKTNEEKTIILNAKGRQYVRLKIGSYIVHSIVSLTSYAALLNYADGEWAKKDTFHYKLI